MTPNLGLQVARKRHRDTTQANARVERVPSADAILKMLRPLPVPQQTTSRQLVEDRRQFHPMRTVRPARTLRGTPARITVKSFADPRWQFEHPRRVLVCVRRKERRQVMFALKRTGKGSRSRRRRRNYFSEVKC